MKEVGVTQEDALKSNWTLTYITSFISAMVVAYILAHFLFYTKADTIGKGIQTAIWIWLGFTAMTMYPSYRFAMRSLKLYLIDIGFALIMMIGYSIVLTVWK
jgi:hypothetical protein